MNAFGYILIGLWILSALLSVGSVGNPREPITPIVAVGTVVVSAVLCVCLVVFGV